jgi:energy-coupling factor transporter ATP-binding protein EcfA2
MTLLEKIRNQLKSETEVGRDYFESPAVYEKEITNGVKWEVLKYGHKKLDEHCPYKQGQLTLIIGHTNVGKSTLILYLLSLLLDRKKLIVYSAENRVSQLARLLIQFFWNVTSGHERYFKWLRERVLFVKHVKQFTYKDMLEQLSFSDDIGFCADMILIDPYNSLKVDARGNTHEYHYDAIENMRIFTQTTQKSIFLNCHTVTESQRVKPDQFGEIKRPMASDVEGGGKFPNKADDTWVIHRQLFSVDPDKRYTSQLYIDKVRNTDGGGYQTPYNEPIFFDFKKDWTGFTNNHDRLGPTVKEDFNFWEK